MDAHSGNASRPSQNNAYMLQFQFSFNSPRTSYSHTHGDTLLIYLILARSPRKNQPIRDRHPLVSSFLHSRSSQLDLAACPSQKRAQTSVPPSARSNPKPIPRPTCPYQGTRGVAHVCLPANQASSLFTGGPPPPPPSAAAAAAPSTNSFRGFTPGQCSVSFNAGFPAGRGLFCAEVPQNSTKLTRRRRGTSISVLPPLSSSRLGGLAQWN
ncbi:hypothetical protein C8R46DRAFT_651709 [Mycena filopes]|nr:hypothetical protein C8R46DRAFT_651709 [Mycena filopes]